MRNRLPKCKVCKKEFKPFQSTQQVCGFQCAQIFAEQKRAKKERKELLDGREKLKTAKDYANEIDLLHQKYSRYRDAELPCISCGKECKPDGNESDGGHYITRRNKALRWVEENCNKQCKYCNQHLKGNYSEYRKGMILKYGLEIVEKLEHCNDPSPKYSIPELQSLKKLYQQKIKDLSK